MANAPLQHIIAGAFVNRQVDVNFRDGDIPQAFAHIHKVHIAGAGILRFACGIALHGAVQLLVIAAGGLLGGWAGGKLFRRVNMIWLRRAFALLILYGGAKSLFGL